MKTKFKISLLENGIHSFNKGLDELIRYEKDTNKDDYTLKEAIMFLHHGIELLLKQILINHSSEYLIFSNINNDTVKKIIEAKQKGISVFNLAKPVHTASYLEIIQRIKAFANNLELEESLETRLINLNTIRNNIEHYGIETEKRKVENLLLKLNKPISKFFSEAGIDIGNENQAKWKELEKQLLIEISRLRLGGGIKRAELQNDYAIVEYVKNYNEYKQIQPQSGVSKEHYESYWDTGNAILKTVNDGGVRLMKKLEFINKVSIRLPFKDYVFYIELNKSDVEKFLGFNFEEIRADWDNTFSNKYVYDKTGSKLFFEKFGKIFENK